jgi:predicted DNA-binding transcriptional regulator YafY
MIGLLKRAAESKEVLEMIYQNNKGEFSQRRIQVIKMSEESFSAYCFTRKQQRTFKISNILSVGPVRKVRRGA